jgi:hypothetical protein
MATSPGSFDSLGRSPHLQSVPGHSDPVHTAQSGNGLLNHAGNGVLNHGAHNPVIHPDPDPSSRAGFPDPERAGVGSAEAAGGGDSSTSLLGIDEVQKALSRSRASVYRYTNTDPRNLNPAFNPRRLNPEYRSDQKDPLLFHPNEVARFARDVLRIKEVTVEVLNAPSTATQQLLGAILTELQAIRSRLDRLDIEGEARSAA